MKIAAIVILYHPGKKAVANILSYSGHFERLYIFDNTTSPSAIHAQLQDIAGAAIYHDGQNRGISERLNSGCKKALEDGYSWVLTMDQDTSFNKNAIECYLHCFNNYTSKEKVAAFGTQHSREVKETSMGCEVEDQYDLITSGMLLNLTAWQQSGGFDEALFIDLVDQEFCVRAGMQGYQTIRFKNIFILHNIGTEVYNSSIKSLYTIRKKKDIHSPLRCYYMYRNMLYLEEKYKNSQPDFSKELRKNVKHHIQVCRYYGRQRAAMRKYITLARKDFEQNAMGKISPDKLPE